MSEEPGRGAPSRVSVIIPALDVAAALPRQLDALTRQTYEGEWEVIVADNGSIDGTREAGQSFSQRLPELQVVDASSRKGGNHARNVGAASARGDFLAYCDADDVVEPDWLAAMADAASRYDLVGGRLDDRALNDRVTAAWRLPHPERGLPVVLGFLPYAVSANFGIWRDVLCGLEGWNETYSGGGEEVDLCWRAQLAGFALGFAPDAVVRYRHRGGLGALGRQFYRYGLAEPRLYRAFRGAGVPRKKLAGAVRNWAWIGVHLPYLATSPEKRGVWVRRAAFGWGRLRGSIQHRVLCL
ncbi:MAG TPA: glycosyltransferase [Actinomycetota bacterium]